MRNDKCSMRIDEFVFITAVIPAFYQLLVLMLILSFYLLIIVDLILAF